jgi:cardiolipin synthase A/B
MTSNWDHWLIWAMATGILAAFAVAARIWSHRGEKRIHRTIRHRYPSEDPSFRRTLSVLFGPTVLPGNEVRSYVNGSRIFPAMLEAIAAAQHSITFETFIYWSGAIGERFADALIERRQAGVPVHLVLDWVGSLKMDQALLERMRQRGVTLVRFHPPRFGMLGRINHRTHRKLLIVDGRIGFTGGVGIADEWDGDADRPDRWRDTHYRIEGPAVAQLQSAFLDNWVKANGELLHGERYFPPLEPVGRSGAQTFCSSPSGGAESMHLMVNYAIVCASRTIRISTAYFVPDAITIAALTAAAARGVRVTVLVPSRRTDSLIARRASQRSWGRMLQAGIRLYAYAPCRLHWKVFIIDDWWLSVGSTNFDNRSFRLNDEANLNVYDAAFAAEQIRQFDADLSVSTPITYPQWRRRPLRQRLFEAGADLFRSQL